MAGDLFIKKSLFEQYRIERKNFSQISNEIQLQAYLDEIEKKTIAVEKNGSIAEIKIFGTLGNNHDLFDLYFFGALDSYYSIIAALEIAENDDEIEEIHFLIDSPGGYVSGLFNLLYKIREVKKPIISFVSSEADSAAYLIISQTDKIIATNEMSEFGSLGLKQTFFVTDDIKTITNTDSPRKSPDPSTAEGVKIIQEELDKFYEKELEFIAEGRSAATGKKITTEKIRKSWGEGGIFFAEEALKLGMIDEIIPRVFFSNKELISDSSLSNLEESITGKNMNESLTLEKFQKNSPELFKEVQKTARETEKNRILALLKMGISCARMEYALECIKNDKSIKDDDVQAEFLSAKINKKEKDERAEDNPSEIDPAQKSVLADSMQKQTSTEEETQVELQRMIKLYDKTSSI